MCSKISLGDEKLDEIIEDIKEKNLARNSFPKLIVGTGLSASFGVHGMSKLSTQLEKNLSRHPDSTIQDLWLKKADDVKQYGLEEGLKSLAPTEERLVEEIRKVTAAFILQEEEKLHKQIANADSGFAKLLKYLKETCSVNYRILDIMTPNYDRIIEIICDSLGIGVITGFEGEVYESFQPWVLKNPEKYYNTKRNFYVRLFKPHGSINWIRKNEIEYLSNDYEVLKKNNEYIEIITPGSSKYEVGLTNNTFRTMREDFNERISDVQKSFSLLIYGYGFNDEHFNTVLFQNSNMNMLILSYEVKGEILDKAINNSHMTIFYQQDKKNYMIYKSEKYEVDVALWDIDKFVETIIG